MTGAEARIGRAQMNAHHLDTKVKFHASREAAVETSIASIEVHVLRDGSVEFICEQSTKKFDGKRWHSESVILTLSPDQVAQLKAALPEVAR
jgi:hypothetical protein